MSTLLDEETVVLDALDFEPRCDCVNLETRQLCGVAATHWLRCTVCSQPVGMACEQHRARLDEADWTVTHTVCGKSAPMCVLVEAVPL